MKTLLFVLAIVAISGFGWMTAGNHVPSSNPQLGSQMLSGDAARLPNGRPITQFP